MLKDEVVERLRGCRAELDTFGMRSLHLFGSVARGQERPDSDVDLLVEFDRPVGLFDVTRLRIRLEEILARRVDLVPGDALKPRIREEVLGECIRAA